jgi:DNA-binding response OmpR family regulator
MLIAITVLVVDDEELDRTLIAQLLTTIGCAVFEVEDYDKAIASFSRNKDLIQLLVTDISLPDGNGCDLAVKLMKQRPDLRVLFVSGHVGAEVCKYYGLDVSDRHFLRKPFSAAQLRTRVEEVLNADAGCSIKPASGHATSD